MENTVPENQRTNSEATEAAAPDADATVKTTPVEAPKEERSGFIQWITDLPNGW